MLIYAINFHTGLTIEKITGIILITKSNRPLRLFCSRNFVLLDAKEKLNTQKCVEFHALSFYPSEMRSGGVAHLRSNPAMSVVSLAVRPLI
jgi:hypothetical protein